MDGIIYEPGTMPDDNTAPASSTPLRMQFDINSNGEWNCSANPGATGSVPLFCPVVGQLSYKIGSRWRVVAGQWSAFVVGVTVGAEPDVGIVIRDTVGTDKYIALYENCPGDTGQDTESGEYSILEKCLSREDLIFDDEPIAIWFQTSVPIEALGPVTANYITASVVIELIEES
jgi:hypothetical protein